MKGNILGEPLEPFVNHEILLRQSAHGSGGIEALPRNTKILNYLNNRSPWIKLASGISLDNIDRLTDITQGELGTGITKAIAQNYSGKKLAENFILFNTVSALENKNYAFRSGVKKTKDILDLLKQYGGIGGTNQGLQPVPGITNIKVNSVNRGSIRKAQVSLKAYNKLQFSILELLYLRLGCTMMLEWGWDKQLVVEQTTPLKVGTKDIGSTIIEQYWFRDVAYTQTYMIQLVKQFQELYTGNYDGFFGKVSNFSWKYGNDGSYDITIDLITVGDVVESLVSNVGFKGLTGNQLTKLKLAYKKLTSSGNVDISDSFLNPGEGDSKSDNELLIEVASTDVLTNWLFTNGITYQPDTNQGDFFDLKSGVGKQYKYLASEGIPNFENYYVTLGAFLKFLEQRVLPKIKVGNQKEPILTIDVNQNTNLIIAYFDQVSLDPRKVLIAPRWSTKVYNSFTKVDNKPYPPLFFDKLKPFTHFEEITKSDGSKSNVVYGKLMNTYLNTSYLIKLIKNKKNNKDEVPLFPFLKAICDDINKCLGSVNNIEPIVKDDKTITFIDQNPIPGLEQIASSIGLNNLTKTSVPINVYGYGPNGSNFVKNIGFQTKIGPNLASTITISATGGNNNTKNYDGTAFSKWNEGLGDRFNESVIEEEYDCDIQEATTLPTEEEFQKAKKTVEAQQYKINKDSYDWEVNCLIGEGEKLSTGGKFSAKDRFSVYKNKIVKKQLKIPLTNINFGSAYNTVGETIFLGYMLPNGKLFPASQYDDTDEGYRQFLLDAAEIYYEEEAQELKEETDLQTRLDSAKNYYEAWLISAFGGSITNDLINITSTLDISKANYFTWAIDDWFARGKKSFKEFANRTFNQHYKETKTPSPSIGFIPVEFNLEVDGISGIKIYNSFRINQQFLPPQYPKALKFLIQGLDHKVDGNGWSTNLKTLSVPLSDSQASTEVASELSLEDLKELQAFIPPGPPISDPSSGYTPSGGTFDITNPTSLDVTTPSGFPVLSKNQISGQNQIVVGNGGKYSKYIGDIDKTPGLKRIYFDEITKKSSVIIHHTAGWSYGQPNGAASSVEGWTHKAVKDNYPVATHYIITQDGHVELVFNEAFWSYHGSIGSQDKYTIGIELQALGHMENRTKGSDGSISYSRKNIIVDQNKARKYLKNSVTSQSVIDVDALFSRPVDESGNEISFRGYDYFQKYTPEQLQSLEKVLRGIKSRHPQIDFTYNYNNLFPSKPLYNANTANLKNRSGVWTHNTFTGKTDVFPQPELLSLLKRLGTELGGPRALRDGKFYGEDMNFEYDAVTGNPDTSVRKTTTAWEYKVLMFDVIDTVLQEMKSLSSEFGGDATPKAFGDEHDLYSEVGELWQSGTKLKDCIKTDNDDRILQRFNNNDGWYKTNEAKKQWVVANLAQNKTYRRDYLSGYYTPNLTDSDLENAWEKLGGIFNGEQVNF